MSLIIPFVIITLLVLLNGVFVAAEFAIIGVRPSKLAKLSEDGNQTAQWVYDIIQDTMKTDRYIATAQLGITLASLGLGMYGEPAIAHFIEVPLHTWFGLEGAIVHTISFVIALSGITYLHVVIGEMVPKSLALSSAEDVVLRLASPMRFSEQLFSLPVTLLNRIGLFVLKLMHIPPPGEGSSLYTADELEMIVTESYRGGLLALREQELVTRVFDFKERNVGQVMTPRTSVEAVPSDIAEDTLMEKMANSIHSRLPIYVENIDKIIGVIHIKDLVRQQLSENPFDLQTLLHQVSFVPETVPIDEMFDRFQKERLHLAVVVDEYGGTEGIVTLEDLIEEVLGEVRDEFDTDEVLPIIKKGEGYLLVQGAVLIEDVGEYVSINRNSHNVQSIGGLILAELGRPPEAGDEVTLDGIVLRVETVQELSIQRVSIRFKSE